MKHSSVCLGSSLEIAQAFRDAGFPENVFQVVLGDYRTGESLVQSDIDAVSVTGSVSTGKRVGELATRGLKKFVLELGGSDPFIVLEDADLNQTAHMEPSPDFSTPVRLHFCETIHSRTGGCQEIH